jgi:hypothetical protein
MDPRAFLDRWHRIVAERDMQALAEIVAPDISMGAPPYWDRLEGKDLVVHLLGVILDTIEDFAYRREWIDGPELALEFRGHVGDRQVQGIDLISLDSQGRVRRLDVLIRPLNSLQHLRDVVAPRMAEYLAGLKQ